MERIAAAVGQVVPPGVSPGETPSPTSTRGEANTLLRDYWRSAREGGGAPLATVELSDELTCPRCRGAGWLRRDVPVTDPTFGQIVRCDCADAIRRAQIGAGLEEHQWRQQFASFRQREGTVAAYQAAEAWAERPEGWLVLMGPPGTGKTHLLSAMANRLIERGRSPHYWAAIDLLGWLREGMQDGATLPFSARLDYVCRLPLLLLDDLGAERITDWAAEVWMTVLDRRYRDQSATVIATNLTPAEIAEQLGERVASRLSDRRLCRVRGLTADDYRPELRREAE